MTYKQRLDGYIAEIEDALYNYLPNSDILQGIVVEAMNYSLKAGGKRIRPVLVLEFMRACGGDYKKALPFACALEMIHTYSLIHDDLPCMDNDDFRRGKPSCHKAYGETNALLAGDALLTYAFETAIKNTDTQSIGADRVLSALGVLADAAGINGMIGGQVIDLESENKTIGNEILQQMHLLKTGALIKAAAQIGSILAGAPQNIQKYAIDYCEKIGLAFQIVDDILDVMGDANALGKPIGSDKDNNKTTFVTLYGIEKSKELAMNYTELAKANLKNIPFADNFLFDLADSLVIRQK